ncbi:hypothetical protein EAH75_01350 [Rhodanobacter glycinis]|uniref:recombination protein NinB n=1 Tax=Rhodanobacter glycinis TaxID=582702 RepID=UPI0011264361|nr:recombination protein NinB [Rhodanobacter glycinis]TPG50171.1 hypothetical protein EAH75_01350 [Rhodanobacter glycinis]
MSAQASRAEYPPRTVYLRTKIQRETAISMINNAPLDDDSPLELVLREKQKSRKLDQNSLMWAGPLRDIEEQGYLDGRTYSAEVWHEYFKRQYLPEEYDPQLCREGYRKWDILPDGSRELIGSTTQLTVRGMAAYMTQVEAFGASLGVMFHVRERRAA